MIDWFKQLTHREQQSLLIAALVLVLMIIYFLFWEPLVKERAQLEQAVSAQKENLRWMQAAAIEIQQLRQSLDAAKPTAKNKPSLLSLIDHSTRQGVLEKTEKRIEPKGEQAVTVTLKAVNFTDFIQWLEQLSNNHQIIVKTIHIESLSTPEQVKIDITLTN
jgi:type II secretory pathway component PulM